MAEYINGECVTRRPRLTSYEKARIMRRYKFYESVKQKHSPQALAQAFDVSHATISNIVRGKE